MAASVISTLRADCLARVLLVLRPRGHAGARAGDRRIEPRRIGASRPIVGRARPGQAVIELAFILPVFLMLALGVIEFGRAFQTQIVMIQAAREGARVGTDPTTTVAQIQAAAIEAALPYVITSADVDLSVAGQVQVTATYRFETILSSLWFIDDMDIKGTVLGRRV